MANVSVDQPDGTIWMSRGGAALVPYVVKNGMAEVEESDVDLFLRCVPGSSVSVGSSSSKPEQKEP